MDERDTVMEEGMTGGEDQSLEISSDLIRGHINTIILRCLYDGDKYGYDIINEIEKKSGGLYTLKQPTLYSALKRLEALRYVTSYYGDSSYGGRRKYFSLTDLGREITEKNLAEWEYSRTIIDSLISDGEAHYDFSFITEKQRELEEMKKTLVFFVFIIFFIQKSRGISLESIKISFFSKGGISRFLPYIYAIIVIEITYKIRYNYGKHSYYAEKFFRRNCYETIKAQIMVKARYDCRIDACNLYKLCSRSVIVES